ncbi:MAG: Spy/CpxP family protein refolding chaperone [Roseiarcus sp.]|jgi:hypothetical protein
MFAIRTGTTIAAATLVGAFLSMVPLQAGYAQQAAAPPPAMTDQATHATDRTDARIGELHARLHINAAQEPLWAVVAQTMHDNAAELRASVADQLAHRDTMTAVDDLKFFQIVADEHSNGLKKFIPAFAALYDAMTPAQQSQADRVFKHHRRMAGY